MTLADWDDRDHDWRNRAACVTAVADGTADVDDWFPPRNRHPVRAYIICGSCPVHVQCRQFADSFELTPPGVWGGASEATRRREARQGRTR